ncbi:MAG: type III pantothenate kinase [Gallionella sp.]|nr:type III pantothenate kinase [Gallionella sp.]
MWLLIDAGNTRIKWALVKDDTWLRNGMLPIDRAGELAKHLGDTSQLEQIWASSVASEKVAENIRALFSQPVKFIIASEMQCGVRNHYCKATQLGSDRWAALIAAWHLIGHACLVVNSGTATTIDALTSQGHFLGGVILPGVEMMQSSLVTGTARIGPMHGQYAPFPQSTADAILSGALQASCGAIRLQYSLLKNMSAPIIMCGGAAATLYPYLNDLPVQQVDNLVLQGLLLLAQEANA